MEALLRGGFTGAPSLSSAIGGFPTLPIVAQIAPPAPLPSPSLKFLFLCIMELFQLLRGGGEWLLSQLGGRPPPKLPLSHSLDVSGAGPYQQVHQSTPGREGGGALGGTCQQLQS